MEQTKDLPRLRRMSNDAYINFFMFIVLLVFCAIASFIVPTFLGVGTFSNILAQQSYLILIGIPVTFLLLTGNFSTCRSARSPRAPPCCRCISASRRRPRRASWA